MAPERCDLQMDGVKIFWWICEVCRTPVYYGCDVSGRMEAICFNCHALRWGVGSATATTEHSCPAEQRLVCVCGTMATTAGMLTGVPVAAAGEVPLDTSDEEAFHEGEDDETDEDDVERGFMAICLRRDELRRFGYNP